MSGIYRIYRTTVRTHAVTTHETVGSLQVFPRQSHGLLVEVIRELGTRMGRVHHERNRFALHLRVAKRVTVEGLTTRWGPPNDGQVAKLVWN